MTVTIAEPMRLRTLLDSVQYAVSTDLTRYNLNGIQLERDGDELLAIATDGHRLSCHRVADFPLPIPDRGCIVPMHALKAIRKSLHRKGGQSPHEGDFAHHDGGFVMVPFRRPEVSVAPFDADGADLGDFPKWRQVVPPHNVASDFVKVADANALADAFEVLGAIRRPVKVETTGSAIRLSVEAKLNGGTITGSSSHDAIGGPPADLAVDGSYMADALRALGGEVEIRFDADPLTPLMVRRGSNFELVMPMPD